MLLKNCKYLVTQDKERRILEGYDLLIEKNLIVKIGKNIFANVHDTIDCSQKIVLPGLINCHTHIGMQSLRGICDDEELPTWLKKVVAAEKKLSKQQLQENAMMACREMINNGITCFMDMYYPMEHIVGAVQTSGMRAILCPAIHDLLGGEEKQFTDVLQIRKRISSSSIVQLGIGSHSIYACSEKMLRKIKSYADAYDLLIVIHIAETRKERYDIFQKTKKLPIEYLESIGFLGKNVLLVHAIWLTKGEVKIIAKHGASVVHCPISNMKLSSGGVTPLMEMWESGVNVGLGTDSVASNNNIDLFTEMKVCGLLHKHHRWDPKAAKVQDILDMATIVGAKILGKEKEIGSLEPGKCADIITVPIDEHLFPVASTNVISHLVYSTQGSQVADVIINGVKVK